MKQYFRTAWRSTNSTVCAICISMISIGNLNFYLYIESSSQLHAFISRGINPVIEKHEHLNWQCSMTTIHLPFIPFYRYISYALVKYTYAFLKKVGFIIFGGLRDVCFYRTRMIKSISIHFNEKNSFDMNRLTCKLQNKLNLHLKVLLYYQFIQVVDPPV